MVDRCRDQRFTALNSPNPAPCRRGGFYRAAGETGSHSEAELQLSSDTVAGDGDDKSQIWETEER